MPRAKAAAASDRIANKRKRDQPQGAPFPDGSGDPSAAAKAGDGGKKFPRVSKTDNAVPPLSRSPSSGSLVASDLPWPEHFTRLGQTHKALNLVFTFCCTRKHL